TGALEPDGHGDGFLCLRSRGLPLHVHDPDGQLPVRRGGRFRRRRAGLRFVCATAGVDADVPAVAELPRAGRAAGVPQGLQVPGRDQA
ncbi:unnamed protein product, partial [Heterosigma akashiwo]